jgi:tetratricopeptide (TPR) repeat protein
MSSSTSSLLFRGITAAKAGDLDEARYYLERALNSEPSTHECAETWFWLSEIAPDPAQKRNCLEEALALDPFDARARRSLAILDRKSVV